MNTRTAAVRIFFASFITAVLIGGALSPIAFAGYSGSRLIDNSIFLNSSTMSINDIQSFLAGKGSGLTTMSFLFDCNSTGMSATYYQSAGAPCGQNVSAAAIIYYASQIYGVNPQVILATLQKEQSLVTSPNPTSWQVNQAMGYGCPDSGGCGASSFLYQIDNGVWVLRFHMERARGNMDYWFRSTSWVCGTPKNYYTPNLYPNQNVSFYDDNGVQYTTIFLENAASSSLYCYTPHAYNNPKGLYGLPAQGTTGQYYSGSYNFVTYFERWFGPTKVGECNTLTNPPAGLPAGLRVTGMKQNGTTSLGLIIANNTGSLCTEVHQWGRDYQSWISHIATIQSQFDPSTGEVVTLDNGSGESRFVFIKYKNTVNDMVELHEWSNSSRQWILHTVTSLPNSDMANGMIIPRGNTLVFVKTKNTSYGMIELHEWTTSLNDWAAHTVSAQPSSEAENGTVISRGDRVVFVKYKNTPSGTLEFHEFAPSYTDWTKHIISSQPNTEIDNGKIVSIGDHLAYIKFRNTPSGYMEVHEWLPDYSNWQSHIVSNQMLNVAPY